MVVLKGVEEAKDAAAYNPDNVRTSLFNTTKMEWEPTTDTKDTEEDPDCLAHVPAGGLRRRGGNVVGYVYLISD